MPTTGRPACPPLVGYGAGVGTGLRPSDTGPSKGAGEGVGTDRGATGGAGTGAGAGARAGTEADAATRALASRARTSTTPGAGAAEEEEEDGTDRGGTPTDAAVMPAGGWDMPALRADANNISRMAGCLPDTSGVLRGVGVGRMETARGGAALDRTMAGSANRTDAAPVAAGPAVGGGTGAVTGTDEFAATWRARADTSNPPLAGMATLTPSLPG